MRNPNKVYSREALLTYVWGNKAMDSGDVRTVDVHVRRLRENRTQSQRPKVCTYEVGCGILFQGKGLRTAKDAKEDRRWMVLP